MKLFLDTHVLVWLFERKKSPFSKNALDLLNQSDLYFPSISFLEINFLKESGKSNFDAENLLDDLLSNINLAFAHSNSLEQSKIAGTLSWTRDPFDRMIVAEAVLNKAKLLTKDRLILKNFNDSTW